MSGPQTDAELGTASAGQKLSPADVFDGQWYLQRYPDVSADDPLQHYLTSGWREGRDPHPAFDTDWYASAYPDAGPAGVDPLWHFLSVGRHRLYRPNPLFDPTWYRDQNGLAEAWDPFTHFVLIGRAAGLAPGPAVAAMSRPTPSTASTARTTVIIPAGVDFVHADRCIQALAGTEAAVDTDVIVVTGTAGAPEVDGRWRRLESYPWVTVAATLPEHITGDHVLLLRPDTEPLPGFLHALVTHHRTAAPAGSGIALTHPRARATLAAPGVSSGWFRVTQLRLPPQAVLIDRASWPALARSLTGLDPDRFVPTAVSTARHSAAAPDSWVLSHRPMTAALHVEQSLPRWDPDRAAPLWLLAAEVDRPVCTTAVTAWLQAAACDIPGATKSVEDWRLRLQALPSEERDELPRLVRRRDQLVSDIVQECLLQPTATAEAAAALRSGSLRAAVEGLDRHPDSYPCAVAVVTLTSRTRPAAAHPHREQIPHQIVQGWFDSPAPTDALAVSRSWQEHHPGWPYRFFDTGSAADWIHEHLGPDHEQVFRSATPVGKSNLFRYAYLAEAGGVWSDTDDRCRGDLSPLITSGSLVVVQETIGAVADNFIAAAPGHPVLVATRDEAFRNVGDGFGESPWLANGPGVFTRKVAAWLGRRLGASPTDTVVLGGHQISHYVSMHEPLHYKETELAWDVTDGDVAAMTARPLSHRQRALQRHDSTSPQ